jgi:hypothetical protein
MKTHTLLGPIERPGAAIEVHKPINSEKCVYLVLAFVSEYHHQLKPEYKATPISIKTNTRGEKFISYRIEYSV